MLNYLAKYSIAQCILSGEKKDLTKSPAIIGIFELTSKGMYQADFSQMDIDIYIGSAITIESRLGGGPMFPNMKNAFKKMTEDHIDFIDAFLDTIPQNDIIIFDDGERYASVIMSIIAELAWKKGKYATCIGTVPFSYEGSGCRRKFNKSWQVVELMAERSILYGDTCRYEGMNITDSVALRRKNIMQFTDKEWEKRKDSYNK